MSGIVGVIANDSARYTLFWTCLDKLELPHGWRKETLIGGDWCGARNALCQMTLDTQAEWLFFMPNRNRRISLIYGGKFNPDNTGWLEIWLDGVNVFPRTNRPTMWAGDVNTYFKVGPYKNKANHFPSGKTVMYFTRIAIGDTRPF